MSGTPLTPVSRFDDVIQYEKSDTVTGGAGGTMNRAPQQMVNRTQWLKDQLSVVGAGVNVAIVNAQAATAQAVAAAQAAPKAIYKTVALGLAATPVNMYFGFANTATSMTDYYRNDAGSATYVFSDATQDAVNAAVVKGQAASALATSVGNNTAAGGIRLQQYTPPGTVIPLFAGIDGGIFQGVDLATGDVVGSMVTSLNKQLLAQESLSAMLLYDADDVVPVWVDSLNNLVLGYRQSTAKFEGSFIDQIDAYGESLTGVRAKWKPLPTSLVVAQTDWTGIPMYGQSLSVGAQGHPALSVTQPYSNLTFSGGPKSAVGAMTNASKPLVEDNLAEGGESSDTHGETMCSGMANSLVEFAAAESGVVPAGMPIFTSSPGQSGQPLAALVKGTQYYTRLLGHVQAAKNLATAAGKTYAVPFVHLVQGETDNDNGTTQAAWFAMATQWVADLNADIPALTGQATPVHVLTYQTPYKAVAAAGAVQLAQKQWVDTNPLVHFSTPIYHLPYYEDRTHMINIGYLRAGRAIGRAAKHLIIDKREPDALVPISATARGLTLSVRFDVPMTPLVLDVTALAATQDFGFRVVDDTSTVAISGVHVVGGDTVQLTLARALGANPRVRYALDYLGSGLFIQDGGSGNLRDSTPDTTTINGTTYPMWHVAFAFQQTIITLGS